MSDVGPDLDRMKWVSVFQRCLRVTSQKSSIRYSDPAPLKNYKDKKWKDWFEFLNLEKKEWTWKKFILISQKRLNMDSMQFTCLQKSKSKKCDDNICLLNCEINLCELARKTGLEHYNALQCSRKDRIGAIHKMEVAGAPLLTTV